MKNKFVYIASGFCVVALGYAQFSDNDQDATYSNSDSMSTFQQTALSNDESQANTNTSLQQQMTQMTASSNNNSARFVRTSTDNDALYRSVEAKYAKIIDESNRYHRQPIDIESMTQDQRVALSNNPRAIVLKHRAFVVGEDYQGDDGALYLISEKPLTKPQFDTLEALGVVTQNKIHPTVWIAHYDKADSISAVLQQDFIVGTGRISPLDKVNPSTLVGFDQSNQTSKEVVVSLSSKNQLNAFRQQYPDITINNSDVTYDQSLITATIPNEQFIKTASSALVDWIEDTPPPVETTNAQASKLSGVDNVRQGITTNVYYGGPKIGIWDEGPIADHPEFKFGNLVLYENVETDSPISSHATHVAGTIRALGWDKKAKGMTSASRVYGYDFLGGSTETINELNSTEVPISNHSWGYLSGWGSGAKPANDVFGDYNIFTSSYDAVIKKKDMTFLKSAGNHREHCNPNDKSDCDGDKDGYKSVSMLSSAKNVISVGATQDDGRTVTNFTSFGPTDDGRIKPDIMANGESVYSTYYDKVTKTMGYKVFWGTSMSTPVASGSAALIMNAYEKNFKMVPRAATLKTLMLHSAEDIGRKGPDYQTGWGFLKTDKAIEIIESGSPYIFESGIINSPSWNVHTIKVDSSKPLKVTLGWTDVEGAPNAAKALVNDINVFLMPPSGTFYKPWVLDPNNPNAPATAGINNTDNVEQIVVDSPQSGEWKVLVVGYSINKEGQKYSMVSSYPRIS